MSFLDKLFRPDIKKLEASSDVDRLIKALDYKWDSEVRTDAARSLKNLALILAKNEYAETIVTSIVVSLFNRLQDKDTDVRSACATALGNIRHERTAQFLISALENDHPTVRSAAATYLQFHYKDNEQTIQKLINTLQDEEEEVRQSVVHSLGEIKNIQATSSLIDTLQKDSSWKVRKASAEALEKIGNMEAVEALTIALGDDEPVVRSASARALKAISDSRSTDL
jgi:HEAT repeat protein